MSDPDIFGVRGGAKTAGGKVAGWLKNAGLFTGALLITIALGTFVKAYAGGGAAKSSGAYYLQATTAMRPGDVISSETAVWRSAVGKRSSGWITDASKKSDTYWGWRVIAPVSAGHAIPKQSVVAVNLAENVLTLPQDKVGFVLVGDELAAATELLQTGSWVNVIAVVGGNRRKVDAPSPTVATVVERSQVLHVRAGLKRGGRGLDPSVTIAVTPEEAEDLAAWRQAGSLVLVLASANGRASTNQGTFRQLWEEVPVQDTAAETLVVPETQFAAAIPSGRSVSVVTPAGVTEQAVQ